MNDCPYYYLAGGCELFCLSLVTAGIKNKYFN